MRNRVVFGLTLAIAVPALAFAQAANVAGKWTGEVQGGRGPTPVTLELTVTGAAVAGKLTQGQGMPVDIQNAKLEGNKLTFSAPGGGGGGRGGGGGGGGGALFNYTATVTGAEMSVTREPAAPAGGAPGAGAPPAGAPPAGGPPAGAGGGGGGGGRGGGGPVTFTLKKA